MNYKIYLLIIMISLSAISCKSDRNPLLESFNTSFETPPFSNIKNSHFLPAIHEALSESRLEIEEILNNEESPNFSNTIEALSFAGKKLFLIDNIFYNLTQAETTEEMQAIAREISPLMSDYNSDILFNEKLFERIKHVFYNQDKTQLTLEQKTLLEKTYKGFTRNGAELSDEKKARLREISKELSDIGLRFNDNVLAETNSWFLHLFNEEDLAGLPVSLVEAASQEAQIRNLEGWVITLHAPIYWPFIHYSENRELREKVFMAYNKRAYNANEYDNTELILKLANLRLERAQLLGYNSHAEFVLVERMAETPDIVNEFLRDLAKAAMPAALKNLEAVQNFAFEKGLNDKVQYWDWYYYSEKMKKELFDFDQEEAREYLQLEKVKNGIFELCNRLWGISFKLNNEIDLYHSEVSVYEVYDYDETLLSVLYLDFFPRPGKSAGAWMTSFRSQHKVDGENVIPQISIVCNFTRPTKNLPSLLTLNEYTTFLHEFGHALHGIFSDVTYTDLSGTSLYRDFVELPSHIMENWAFEKEFLDIFATHYESGEKMPDDLVQKIIDSKNFHSGFMILRQLSFSLNDMTWHSITEPVKKHPEEFEVKAMAPTFILPVVDGTMMSSAFTHIFSGGYAAGYYGYKWAEVLDADAYEAFIENEIFDRKTADLFREHILSKGGTEHPMILYKRFRGEEPAIEPYLRREGLIE